MVLLLLSFLLLYIGHGGGIACIIWFIIVDVGGGGGGVSLMHHYLYQFHITFHQRSTTVRITLTLLLEFSPHSTTSCVGRFLTGNTTT